MSNEQAESLTRYLTERTSPYDHKSPLAKRVEAGIDKLTAEIAAEVIAENPELRTVIRAKVTQVISQALRDDTYLNGTVTRAISAALTNHALGKDEDD